MGLLGRVRYQQWVVGRQKQGGDLLGQPLGVELGTDAPQVVVVVVEGVDPFQWPVGSSDPGQPLHGFRLGELRLAGKGRHGEDELDAIFLAGAPQLPESLLVRIIELGLLGIEVLDGGDFFAGMGMPEVVEVGLRWPIMWLLEAVPKMKVEGIQYGFGVF